LKQSKNTHQAGGILRGMPPRPDRLGNLMIGIKQGKGAKNRAKKRPQAEDNATDAGAQYRRVQESGGDEEDDHYVGVECDEDVRFHTFPF